MSIETSCFQSIIQHVEVAGNVEIQCNMLTVIEIAHTNADAPFQIQ